MSVDARNILNHQATDADHRIFVQAIHDMVIAAGLVQTADTGQANLSTITRPNAFASSGYEIFRFNDSEQAILPCFVRIDYSSGQVNTIPSVLIRVGTATNGAGVLLNLQSTGFIAWATTADAVSQVRSAFASFAEGQFCLAFGLDAANSRGLFVYIGRPRLYNGTITTDGFIVLYRSTGGSSAMGHGVIRAGGGASLLITSGAGIDFPAMRVLGGQDDQVGANIGLYPLSYAINGNLRFASVFSYRSTAIAVDAQQSVNVYGSSKNYRTMGSLFAMGDSSLVVPYF